MKNFIKAITIVAIVFVICYMFGAFVMLDLNVYNWSFDVRFVTGVLFLVLSLVCVVVSLAINEL